MDGPDQAFAYPFPITVISDMLGIPREDRETIRGWKENLLSADRLRGREMDEETRAGLREFIDYLQDLFERKRRAPTDDMISRLVHAEEDGDVLDGDEVLSTVFLMFLAGHVTSVNLIVNGVVALLTHPDQLAKLKANTELAKGVVEETLRYWGPIDFIGRRIAKEDVEVGGTVIPSGERRRSAWRLPTGIQRGSQTPTSSTLPVPMPTGTSPLERASTSASGRHWHGLRVR